jgi:hypothetical protein
VFSGGWDAVETRGDPKDFAARWAAYVALYDPNVVIHEAPSLPYGGDYSRYRGTFGGGHPQSFNHGLAPWSVRQAGSSYLRESRAACATFVACETSPILLEGTFVRRRWLGSGRMPS